MTGPRKDCCAGRDAGLSPWGRAPHRHDALGVFLAKKGLIMADDDYVYDDVTGEWRPAGEVAAEADAAQVVRDSAGTVLADGDQVVLIKDLKVKGTSTVLKQGTVIRSIRLTADPAEVDCRHDTVKGLVLRTEFLRKR